jgi:hypothetical protein
MERRPLLDGTIPSAKSLRNTSPRIISGSKVLNLEHSRAALLIRGKTSIKILTTKFSIVY